jgi:hypothetical protein
MPVRMADVARRQSCVEWMGGSSAGRPDFRFGFSEIGAFSSFLSWFWGFGFGEAAARKRLLWGRRRWGAKKTKAFLGCPRPRNEKPGAVSRAGLGHTPEEYLFNTWVPFQRPT